MRSRKNKITSVEMQEYACAGLLGMLLPWEMEEDRSDGIVELHGRFPCQGTTLVENVKPFLILRIREINFWLHLIGALARARCRHIYTCPTKRGRGRHKRMISARHLELLPYAVAPLGLDRTELVAKTTPFPLWLFSNKRHQLAPRPLIEF